MVNLNLGFIYPNLKFKHQNQRWKYWLFVKIYGIIMLPELVYNVMYTLERNLTEQIH